MDQFAAGLAMRSIYPHEQRATRWLSYKRVRDVRDMNMEWPDSPYPLKRPRTGDHARLPLQLPRPRGSLKVGSDCRQPCTSLGNELSASPLCVRLPVLRHGEAMWTLSEGREVAYILAILQPMTPDKCFIKPRDHVGSG